VINYLVNAMRDYGYVSVAAIPAAREEKLYANHGCQDPAGGA